jgi:hypothetical protein
MNSTNGRREWTHCQRGHEFTPENTYQTKTGARRCRRCVRELKWLRRQRAANSFSGPGGYKTLPIKG